MVTLRRIGVRSAGMVGFWLGAALVITQVIIFVAITLITSDQFPSWLFSLEFVFAILRITLLAAVQTAFTLGALAYIYNLVANWHGGIQFEFDQAPPARKRKNDEIHGGEGGNGTEDDDSPSTTGTNKTRVEID